MAQARKPLASRGAELRLVGLARLVAGRREIRDAARGHCIDRLGDHAVLEHRLVEVADIIHDDFRAVIGERSDARGKVLFTGERGMK